MSSTGFLSMGSLSMLTSETRFTLVGIGQTRLFERLSFAENRSHNEPSTESNEFQVIHRQDLRRGNDAFFFVIICSECDSN